MHCRAFVVGGPDDRQRTADLAAARVAGRHTRRGRLVRTAAERLAHPDAVLVTRAVVEPPDPGAIGGQQAVACAVLAGSDLTVFARGAVPGVELVSAGRARVVEAAVRCVVGPVRQRDARGTVALFPDRYDGHASSSKPKGRPLGRPSCGVGVTGFEPAASTSRT